MPVEETEEAVISSGAGIITGVCEPSDVGVRIFSKNNMLL